MTIVVNLHSNRGYSIHIFTFNHVCGHILLATLALLLFLFSFRFCVLLFTFLVSKVKKIRFLCFGDQTRKRRADIISYHQLAVP